MNNNFEKLKNTISHWRMTSEEKNVMRAHLVRHIADFNPATSPAQRSPFIMQGIFVRSLQFVAFSLIVVLASGGGVAYAAQDALPGEGLYSFKVNVSEQVVSLSKTTPQAKAEYEIERAKRRLDETTVLALQGKLTPEIETVVSEKLAMHTSNVRAYTEKIDDTRPDLELEIASKIASSITPRTVLLREIKDMNHLNGEVSAILALAEQEVAHITSDKQDSENEVNQSTIIASASSVTKKAEEVQKRLSLLETLAPSTNTQTTKTNEIVETSETATKALELNNGILKDTGIMMNPSNETSISNNIEQADVAVARIEDKTIATLASIAPAPATSKVNVSAKKILIEDLLSQAQVKFDEGKYGEALVLLQQAQEETDSAITFIDLRTEFNIDNLELEKATAENMTTKTQLEALPIIETPQLPTSTIVPLKR